MKIKVIVISNNTYDLTNAIVGKIKYTTTRTGSASTITFDVLKSGEMSFGEGNRVEIYVNGELYIVGYIFTKSKKVDLITVTCYDILRYMQYKQSYNFVKRSSSQIINQMANEFKIPVGNIENTGYILPDKIYDDKTLLDIATDSLMQTTVKTGKVFNLYDKKGKLCLTEASNMISEYVIGSKSFVEEYTYKTSIEKSYNRIKLVKPNKKTGKGETYIAQDSSKIKTWGNLQFYKKVDESMKPEQIKELAKNYLKYYCRKDRILKLECLGILSIRAGTMVYVDIPYLGDIHLNKILLIEKCTQRFSEDEQTMSLEMRVNND